MVDTADGSRVAVVVRVRPPRADGGRLCVSSEGETTVLTHDSGQDRQGKALRFNFARAFAGCSTRTLYECIGRQILEQALAGYHVSLLAYGQTGAGGAARRGAPRASALRRGSRLARVDSALQAAARRTRSSARLRRPAWCPCWPRSCSSG